MSGTSEEPDLISSTLRSANCCCSQDLMNREKRDKIPSMQVSFIDAICTQLYEVHRCCFPCSHFIVTMSLGIQWWVMSLEIQNIQIQHLHVITLPLFGAKQKHQIRNHCFRPLKFILVVLAHSLIIKNNDTNNILIIIIYEIMYFTLTIVLV